MLRTAFTLQNIFYSACLFPNSDLLSVHIYDSEGQLRMKKSLKILPRSSIIAVDSYLLCYNSQKISLTSITDPKFYFERSQAQPQSAMHFKSITQMIFDEESKLLFVSQGNIIFYVMGTADSSLRVKKIYESEGIENFGVNNSNGKIWVLQSNRKIIELQFDWNNKDKLVNKVEQEGRVIKYYSERKWSVFIEQKEQVFAIYIQGSGEWKKNFPKNQRYHFTILSYNEILVVLQEEENRLLLIWKGQMYEQVIPARLQFVSLVMVSVPISDHKSLIIRFSCFEGKGNTLSNIDVSIKKRDYDEDEEIQLYLYNNIQSVITANGFIHPHYISIVSTYLGKELPDIQMTIRFLARIINEENWSRRLALSMRNIDRSQEIWKIIFQRTLFLIQSNNNSIGKFIEFLQIIGDGFEKIVEKSKCRFLFQSLESMLGQFDGDIKVQNSSFGEYLCEGEVTINSLLLYMKTESDQYICCAYSFAIICQNLSLFYTEIPYLQQKTKQLIDFLLLPTSNCIEIHEKLPIITRIAMIEKASISVMLYLAYLSVKTLEYNSCLAILISQNIPSNHPSASSLYIMCGRPHQVYSRMLEEKDTEGSLNNLIEQCLQIGKVKELLEICVSCREVDRNQILEKLSKKCSRKEIEYWIDKQF